MKKTSLSLLFCILLALLLTTGVFAVGSVEEAAIVNPDAEWTVFRQLLHAQTLEEMHQIMMLEENRDDIYALTADELSAVTDAVNTLYNALEVPTADDDEYRELLLDTLTMLSEDAGPVSTLATETAITSSTTTLSDGDYYLSTNVKLSSYIYVPLDVTATIDLRGFVLQGSGNAVGDGDHPDFVIVNYGNLTIKDSNPTLSHTFYLDSDGVALWGEAGTKFTIPGGIIYNNGNGKGILCTNGTVTMAGGTVTGCKSGHGPAITISSTGHFVMTGGRLAYNYSNGSSGGGAIYAEHKNANGPGGIIELNNAIIEYNSSISVSTAIVGYDVSIHDCTIRNNFPSPKSTNCSGAVYIREEDCSLKITGTYDANGNYNCVFENNSALSSGGAVYGVSVSTTANISVSISDAKFIGNSGYHGGAIALEQGYNVTVSNCLFENNVSKNNNLDGAGGAFFIRGRNANNPGDAESLTVTNCIFRDNVAESNCGGLYVYYVPVTITGSQFLNNKCHTSTDSTKPGRGGGLFVYDTSSATVTDCTFTGNTARTGGGIEFAHVEQGIISGCTFTNNTATEAGGGFAFHERNGNITLVHTTNMTDTTISGNTAPIGGGIYVDMSKILNMGSGNVISGNTATTSGGGIHVRGTALMTGGSIADNTAPIGAGVYCQTLSVVSNDVTYTSPASFTLSGGSVTSNDATESGGGIYVHDGSATVNGGSVTDNTAVEYGGGIYVLSSTNAVTSGTLSGNSAGKRGGAAYVAGGTLNIGVENCTGTSNTLHDSGTKTHPVIENNTAPIGGGLSVIDGGTLNVYCGSVANNIANNRGLGENLYMDGGTTNYISGTFGSSAADPGAVVVGGSFLSTGASLTVSYYANFQDAVNPRYDATVTSGGSINLPDGAYYWDRSGSPQYTFLGWSESTLVRAPSDYLALGTSITVSKNTSLYAVWAPETNAITYTYILDENTTPAALNQSLGNAASYTYSTTSNTVHLTSPTVTGYTFQGWVLYVDPSVPTNWDCDTTAGETGLNGIFFPVSDPDAGFDLDCTGRFGDIQLTAYFEEITATIQYVIVAPSNTNAGTLTLTEETIGVVTGEPQGSVAAAAVDYRYIGWYTDAACTQAADASWITVSDKTYHLLPVREDGALWTDAVYYAKFDYAYADLTIEIDGIDTNTNQSYLFTIQGESYEADEPDITMTVAIVCNEDNYGKAIIRHLPVGEYTITEQNGWSWRYTVRANGVATVTLNGPDVNTASYPESGIVSVTTKWINTYSSN